MPTVPITPTAMTADGVNLTDAAYTTMTTGTGNGVEFDYDEKLEIILLNDTGGAAAFKFITPDQPLLVAAGLDAPDKTINLATGKTLLVPPTYLFRNSSGIVTIECDVAGKIVIYLRP